MIYFSLYKINRLKTIKFSAYLLYQYYYNSRSRDIAYLKTLSALTLMLFLHLVQLSSIFLFDWTTYVSGNYWQSLLKLSFVMLSILLLFFLLIKKSELMQMSYNSEKMKKGYFWLIIYSISSFFLTVILSIFIKHP